MDTQCDKCRLRYDGASLPEALDKFIKNHGLPSRCPACAFQVSQGIAQSFSSQWSEAAIESGNLRLEIEFLIFDINRLEYALGRIFDVANEGGGDPGLAEISQKAREALDERGFKQFSRLDKLFKKNDN